MDIFEALSTRRSIRRYTDKDISDEDLEIILKCAMSAPSAKNEQPWHFVVVRDAKMRQTLAKASPYTGMAANAPVVIVACGDLSLEKAPGYWVQDCAAAVENLLLAARGKNIGSVWCGIHPVAEREKFLRDHLGIPANVVPFCLICLGHPEQHFKEENRFMPGRVHHGQW